MADTTLGQNLASTLANLTDLILATKNSDRKEKLRKQHKQLSKKLQDLIDKTVPADTEEYRTATVAVEEGNSAIKQAIKDTAQAADAIEKVAKAISALAKLIGVLAA